MLEIELYRSLVRRDKVNSEVHIDTRKQDTKRLNYRGLSQLCNGGMNTKKPNEQRVRKAGDISRKRTLSNHPNHIHTMTQHPALPSPPLILAKGVAADDAVVKPSLTALSICPPSRQEGDASTLDRVASALKGVSLALVETSVKYLASASATSRYLTTLIKDLLQLMENAPPLLLLFSCFAIGRSWCTCARSGG